MLKLRRLSGAEDTGTLRAILRHAARFIPEQDLHPHFYA